MYFCKWYSIIRIIRIIFIGNRSLKLIFGYINITLWACVHILQLAYAGASPSHSGIKRAAKIALKPGYIGSKTTLKYLCSLLKMVIIPLTTACNRL